MTQVESEINQYPAGGSSGSITTQLTCDKSSQCDPSDFHFPDADLEVHCKGLKRPSYTAALDIFDKHPKLDTHLSVGSSATDSQPLMMSQTSTFSSTSEVSENIKQKQFDQVISCLATLDPVLSDAILAPNRPPSEI